MSINDYISPSLHNLDRLSDQIYLLKSYLDLLPESDFDSDLKQIHAIRLHCSSISNSLDELSSSFSGMVCSLKGSYDISEGESK